jgi:TolB-like protein/Tfp pilus assembly protein PilF
MEGFQSAHTMVRFGDFELDQQTGELRKCGTLVRLQEQPLQILQILLEHPGAIVTREELQQKIWPSDTFVDFDHGINNAIKRLRVTLGDTADTPRYIETLLRRGYRFVAKIERETPRFRSLAVLPLENLSRDPEQEYFAEGLTETLITTLAKIGELRVVSRTSAVLYKGARKPIREIARELGVDTIVEGTVLRVGERVRITAQLIDAQREAHLWAESYDRHLRDILDLHSELAQAIAREVQVKLTPREETELTQAHRVDPRAYEWYLKGRYHWNRRSREGLPQGVKCFQAAIAEDPTYAAAYAGLADCLTGLHCYCLAGPADSGAQAKGPAIQALELQPGLGEAHASVGWVKMWYDYDFIGAEREFERCIELNPRYATGHQWYAFYLSMMGRYEEAYAAIKRALRLDPLSIVIQWSLGFIYWNGRFYDRAIDQLEATLEMDANYAPAHATLAWVYRCKGQHELGIAAARKAVECAPGASFYLAFLGEAYAAAEKQDEAQKVLAQLRELSKQQYVTTYHMGRIYASLGKKDEALAWWETGYRERASWLIFLKIDPMLDDFRADPRFQDLMCCMNYPA